MNRLTIPICLFIVGLYACNKTEKNKETDAAARETYDKYVYALSLVNEKKDSAFFYLNEVVDVAKDTLLLAGAYTYMGIIQYDAGDYFGSQETLLEGLKFLNEKNEAHYEYIAACYNELGKNCKSLKNYEDALRYFELAVTFSKDTVFRSVRLNNKAATYKDLKDYANAINIYRTIISNHNDSSLAYARVLSNLAYTGWLKDAAHKPVPALWQALYIRKKENDKMGVITSYAQLADYYAVATPDSALIYAKKMEQAAKILNSPGSELLALQKLITLAPASNATAYFSRYEFLNDSLQTARNNAANQFALIRYEAEKSKAYTLVLQKENAEKKFRIMIQQVAFAVVIVIIALLFRWYRKRKQRLLREQRLKTSQKVHDVVANGLYRVMMKTEHEQKIEKEVLLDELEILYEQSRNISYEEPDQYNPGQYEKITEMIKSFSTPQRRILIVGNVADCWDKLNTKVQVEMRHVLLELLVNMKKHSKAENVLIKFEKEKNTINIHYSDDGIGISPNDTYGNGLTSTENRMKAIEGQIIFDSLITNGLKIQLIIPITESI